LAIHWRLQVLQSSKEESITPTDLPSPWVTFIDVWHSV
jgi:hypothetical protein